MRSREWLGVLLFALLGALDAPASAQAPALDARPRQLVEAMAPGPLRKRLEACLGARPVRSGFVLSHRGAPLGYPEHTREGYIAAAAQGAGSLECDVTFTRDRELVCRHSQCDLHSTTNILATPLAARCSTPFMPADPVHGLSAGARCCTSDISLAEFRTLCGRHDKVDASARTVEQYLAPSGGECGRLVTHVESVALFRELGTAMIPELKTPEVSMPFDENFTQARFAARMFDDYRAAGIEPARVTAQSFQLEDIRAWQRDQPEFAQQAIWLDPRAERDPRFDGNDPSSWHPTMEELQAAGVHTVAPPIPVLLALDHGRIVPSAYARAARAAGFRVVSWSLERSGPLAQGGGFYYASISPAIHGDGDLYPVLDVLARDVGVAAIFSDWPATVTLYANCMGLQ